MALFAIADLHFAFSVDKPMDIFGENWKNHSEKIIASWKEHITEEDTVLGSLLEKRQRRQTGMAFGL